MTLQANLYPNVSRKKKHKGRPDCDEKILGTSGYLKGERIAMIRDAILKDLCRRVIYAENPDHERVAFVSSFSSLREKVGSERFLILTIISLTIADLGAGDNALESRVKGEDLRRDAFEAIFGAGQEGFKLLCDLAGLEFDYIKMMGHAMLRFMSERMIATDGGERKPEENTPVQAVESEWMGGIDKIDKEAFERECADLGESFEQLTQMPLYFEETVNHVTP